jgi:hypothetical protein
VREWKMMKEICGNKGRHSSNLCDHCMVTLCTI